MWRIRALCAAWDEVMILSALSPYLRIESDDTYVYARFNGERLSFLKRDVLLLPITNATVEEFSHLMLEALMGDEQELTTFGIHGITVKIYSRPGQRGACSGRRTT